MLVRNEISIDKVVTIIHTYLADTILILPCTATSYTYLVDEGDVSLVLEQRLKQYATC